MSQERNPLIEKTRDGYLPHMFCPGCGCGQILNFFLRACDNLGIDTERIVSIAGVGCAARIPVYMKTDAFHGVHGRTLAWATGVKLQKPEVPVVIFAGDGDAASIGGNHLIQAARRNLDVTFIVVNNLNFAMTGGQAAPTTPLQSTLTTTPFGSSEPPFDLCELAASAGATYVGRWTTAHSMATIRAIEDALQHTGFAFLELVSQCPTHFGRYALGSGDPQNTLEWIKDNSVTISRAEELSEEERQSKFVVGEFVKCERPVFKGTSLLEDEVGN
jgi:2-oxoglutarate ferredoxin oxidoreductase subunit beta